MPFGCYLMSLMLLNVSVLREFQEFLNLSIFYFSLVNYLIIPSNYRPNILPYRMQFVFVADVLTERFLAFGTTSFQTKISSFCA